MPQVRLLVGDDATGAVGDATGSVTGDGATGDDAIGAVGDAAGADTGDGATGAVGDATGDGATGARFPIAFC